MDKVVQNLKTIEKISKSKFICVESYRNNKEQFNLQCWALTERERERLIQNLGNIYLKFQVILEILNLFFSNLILSFQTKL